MSTNNLWGLPQAEYAKLASSHSKANIFLWFISGIVYNLITGNLPSLSTVLLVIPGIFIISFASILTFWVDQKKKQIVQKTNNVFILFLFTIWFFIDLVYPIILSILFIDLINYIS